MSDVGPKTASSVPSAKHPWTILGRLTNAVREQNWFAVVLEVLIVIVGVVIGFQVTSWGQERADRVKEQTYLRQLAMDLQETERNLAEGDSLNRPGGEALVKFLAAFTAVPRPPVDSLYVWGLESRLIYFSSPVLGTAEALVSTGDIGLIRDDSLRSAIVSYVERMRHANRLAQSVELSYLQEYKQYERRFDFNEAAKSVLSPAEIDSMTQANYLSADGRGPGRAPYPDPSSMLDDLELYGDLRGFRNSRNDLEFVKAEYADRTRRLAALVEQELDP